MTGRRAPPTVGAKRRVLHGKSVKFVRRAAPPASEIQVDGSSVKVVIVTPSPEAHKRSRISSLVGRKVGILIF